MKLRRVATNYRLCYTFTNSFDERIVDVTLGIDRDETEDIQRSIFEKAILYHAEGEDWCKCRVLNSNGRCVITYYKSGTEPI